MGAKSPHPGAFVQRNLLVSMRSDLVGGLVASAAAIPLAMGFGMFAFVALGDEYFALGAVAGLYTSFFVGLVCVLLGDKSGTIYAPRVETTFFIGVLLYTLLHSSSQFSTGASVTLVLATIFAIMVLGGLFQVLFGLLKLGTLIKFAPHPVMAGFQNAAALLLLLVQLGNVLGFDRSRPFAEAIGNLGAAKPMSVVIALVVFWVMWKGPRWLPRVPTVVLGLAAGTLAYYAVIAAGFPNSVGPTVGKMSAVAFTPLVSWDVRELWAQLAGLNIWLTILGGALALAIIASIDSLLCAKSLTHAGQPGTDGNTLLIRLGIGNAVSASCGGITSGLNPGATHISQEFGARTPLAVLVTATLILLGATVLFPVVSYLPRVAISAVIMVIAVEHVDLWTVRLIRNFATSSATYRRTMATELAVVLLVATLAITVNIILAVFLGVAIAVILFLVRMSRSTIRRLYRGDVVQSRKSRNLHEARTLEKGAASILVLELQGALFFGSAEKLASEIQAQLKRETRYVILDLRRVTEIDSTGSQILNEIHEALHARGIRLGIAVPSHAEVFAKLKDFGVLDTVKGEALFPDVDRALEWAEDTCIRTTAGARPEERELPLDQVSLLSGFTASEIEAVAQHLVRIEYRGGTLVFKEGSPGDELFMITRGTASALLAEDKGGQIRLVTFAAGTVFGELAILDEGLRSASITADGDLVCYVMKKQSFLAMAEHNPAIAIKLLRNLGRELSGRLRRANRTINQLES